MVRWFFPRRLDLVHVEAPCRAPAAKGTAAVIAWCLIWGELLSIAGGGISGSLVIPVAGTAYGMIVGAILGIVPTIAGTIAVVAVVTQHRPLTNPWHLSHQIAKVFTVLWWVSLAGAGWWELGAFDVHIHMTWAGLGVVGWIVGNAVVTGWALKAMLRGVNGFLTATYAESWGWRDGKLVETPSLPTTPTRSCPAAST